MHTRGRPESTIPVLRQTVAEIDSSLPLSDVRTLEEVVTRSLATRRFTMLLLVVFAGLAVVLAMAGVYGVLAYHVARRTAEIAVRLALGAAPARVLGQTFREWHAAGARWSGIGRRRGDLAVAPDGPRCCSTSSRAIR